MSSILEQAKAYVPTETKNIIELEKVPVDMELLTKTVGEGEDSFSYDYVLVDEEEYRVPKSVVIQLKDLVEAEEKDGNTIEFIRVTKSGEGLKTKYLVRKAE